MLGKRICMATSALIEENYDGLRTIEEAADNGFWGVQLYVNQDYHDGQYLDSVIKQLEQKELGLVVHLPNLPQKEDIRVAEGLVSAFPEAPVLIHYKPLTKLPIVSGTRVGWENSVNFPNFEYIREVQRRVEVDETFFVFDFGRLMNTSDPEIQKKVRKFTPLVFETLDPDKDLIHVSDKTGWETSFRESMCAFSRGVMGEEFMPEVKGFADRGGIVVFELENLQMAIDSLKALK